MKKITSQKLSKRLAQYGAMSAAVMAGADANGQVVYTDVDPDVTLQIGDVFSLDFEGDTFEDLSINNPDGLAGGNAAIVFPSSGGALAGFTSGGYEYPLLMAQGDVIDAATGFTTTGVRGDLNYYGCAYSNSQWCGDVTDGYLGVRFINLTAGTTHYGWVRLDTDVNGDNLMTVKDYAFEATPDTAIEAGDQGSLGVTDSAFGAFEYHTSDNALHLSSATMMDQVVLHNVVGQEVARQQINATSATVSMDRLSAGVYIATISAEGQTKSIKISKR
jgi:hypothetical protein